MRRGRRDVGTRLWYSWTQDLTDNLSRLRLRVLTDDPVEGKGPLTQRDLVPTDRRSPSGVGDRVLTLKDTVRVRYRV